MRKENPSVLPQDTIFIILHVRPSMTIFITHGHALLTKGGLDLVTKIGKAIRFKLGLHQPCMRRPIANTVEAHALEIELWP